MHMKVSGRAFSLALILLVALALPAWAQITTGTVSGTVKDAQGGVLPGRDGRADQRDARHEVGAGRHQRAAATTCSRTSRRTPTPSK